MEKSVTVLLLALFAFAAVNCNVISKDPVKSYENFQVLRVEIPSKESFDLLSSVNGLQFWNEGRVGSHRDAMVAPYNIEEVTQKLASLGLQYSTMVENVGELMRLEQVNKQSKSI